MMQAVLYGDGCNTHSLTGLGRPNKFISMRSKAKFVVEMYNTMSVLNEGCILSGSYSSYVPSPPLKLLNIL